MKTQNNFSFLSHPLNKLLRIGAICFPLLACSSLESLSDAKTLQGLVQERNVLANADVFITDHRGNTWRTTTDTQGRYTFSLPRASLPPFTLTAVSESGRLADCVRNDVLRPICLVASVLEDAPVITANINPLSDRVASDYAKYLNVQGPQQLFALTEPYVISTQQQEQALTWVQKSFGEALRELGIIQVEKFNPTTNEQISKNQLNPLFSLLNHNRNYDNTTGLTGHTTLTDSRFKPIVGLFHGGHYEVFDLTAAQNQAKKIEQAKTRIFIVGDSTSAMYEHLRFPRMGWGEAFMQAFSHLDDVAVVVGSRAGRSSRDFYNGRWFAQMETMIRKGDIVFINHGHNDQNCNQARAIRGQADVTNLCTYPNSPDGTLQHPHNQPEMSFDNSLMRYVNIAKARGAQPIVFTPSARILNKNRQQQLPVSSNHFTKPQPQKDYAFTGDYAQTIRQIAARENLPLIDLERESMAFANQLTGNQWWDYWLVVDPSVNSYYANGAAGSPQSPDGTHFQEKGAKVMANLVAQQIKQDPTLADLSKILLLK